MFRGTARKEDALRHALRAEADQKCRGPPDEEERDSCDRTPLLSLPVSHLRSIISDVPCDAVQY